MGFNALPPMPAPPPRLPVRPKTILPREAHERREAERELECWLRSEPYEYRPFCPHATLVGPPRPQDTDELKALVRGDARFNDWTCLRCGAVVK